MIKITLLTAAACFIFNVTVHAGGPGKSGDPIHFQQQKPSVVFTENKGQISDQNYQSRPDVLYSGTAGNFLFHLRTNGISYQLSQVESWKEEIDLRTLENKKKVHQVAIHRVDMNWIGTNPDATIVTDAVLPGSSNYYLSTCPDGALDVKSYAGVTLRDIYTDIDLHYYEKEGSLKYDYIVAPGAGYKQIRWQIAGATVKILENGKLSIQTPLGTIEEEAPLVFQNGRQLKASWVLSGDMVSYDIPKYDPKVELIIDPVVKAWGTYFGGMENEVVNDINQDASGNVFICGSTTSSGSIATSGAFQTTMYGNYDAFLAKFNGSGTRLWATYYGQLHTEHAYSCAMDSGGNVYFTGSSTSSNSTALATAGSHQPSFSEGSGILAKFNTLGVRQWATYYGSNMGTIAYACVIDASDNIYIGGQTQATLGIATAGAHKTTLSGASDCFIAKFNTSGVREWGTYYGGPSAETILNGTIGEVGNIVMVGHTNSVSGIATASSHQQSISSGTDGFFVRFSPSGSRLTASYYGGIGNDLIRGCSWNDNEFCITGSTTAGNGIATAMGHQTAYGGGTSDAFVAKFGASYHRIYGTYIGGSSYDAGSDCVMDDQGVIYVIGTTESVSGISTPGTYQDAIGSIATNVRDAFFIKLDSYGNQYWGTYLGGQGTDHAFTMSTTNFHSFYIGGSTLSTNAMTTPGSHQQAYGSADEGFLMKMLSCENTFSTITVTRCNSYTTPSGNWTFTSSGTYGDILVNSMGCDSIIQINLTIEDLLAPVPQAASLEGAYSSCPVTLSPPTAADNCAGIVTGTTTSTFPISAPGTHLVVWTYNDGNGNTTTQNQVVIITNGNNETVSASNGTLTSGTPGATYQWINCSNGNTPVPGATGQSFTPTANGSYAVIVTQNGCSATSNCVTISTVGLDELDQTLFTVYPNPNNGTFVVTTELPATISITNAAGQLISTHQLESGENTIELSHVESGVYLISAMNSNGQSTVQRVSIIK